MTSTMHAGKTPEIAYLFISSLLRYVHIYSFAGIPKNWVNNDIYYVGSMHMHTAAARKYVSTCMCIY